MRSVFRRSLDSGPGGPYVWLYLSPNDQISGRPKAGIPPSSPSVALFKDGELIHVLERRHIEMMNEEMVSQNLVEAFDKHCSRQGPSVSKEVYDNLATSRQCGSSVPLFNPFR